MTYAEWLEMVSALPMHTTVWRAANGYEETYHAWCWDQFHAVAQAMHARGFDRARWIDRSSWVGERRRP